MHRACLVSRAFSWAIFSLHVFSVRRIGEWAFVVIMQNDHETFRRNSNKVTRSVWPREQRIIILYRHSTSLFRPRTPSATRVTKAPSTTSALQVSDSQLAATRYLPKVVSVSANWCTVARTVAAVDALFLHIRTLIASMSPRDDGPWPPLPWTFGEGAGRRGPL